MAHDDTDSESSLPETVSLSTSASAAKGHDRALRNFHAAEKRKIREKNRRHDERLKVQANMRRHATATTGKGRLYVENHEVGADDPDGGSDTHQRLHSRMTRAMGDAEEETEEVDSGSTSGEEWGGIKAANEEDYQVSADVIVGMLTDEGEEEKKEETRNGNLDSSEVGGDDDDDGPSTLRPLSPPSKYLPDHLFIAAFSKSKLGNLLRPSRTTPKTRSSGKRHSVRTRTKDVVVGTHAVRTLLSSPASSHLQSLGTALPPARIDKFLANTLRFNENGKKTSTLAARWERRPSHLGVMKRTTGAPVTGFARPS
ncbi:hypothetical protein BC826DRAFT_1107797 [Russula brevipes]|nr:hypothetical protein BC826DRAFT_1107797 [Russula brevipes]